MARFSGRTIRFEWRLDEGDSQSVDVFAPATVNNKTMVDRRLRKAGLTGFGELLQTDDQDDWMDQSRLAEALEAANNFFDENPESIPFSDILCEEIPPLIDAVRKIPAEARVRCSTVEP